MSLPNSELPGSFEIDGRVLPSSNASQNYCFAFSLIVWYSYKTVDLRRLTIIDRLLCQFYEG